MTRKRPHISLATKLASALSELEFLRGTALPFHTMQSMDAKTYLHRFDWDHVIPHAHSGDIHYTNLTPMLRADHRRKTATVDVPRIAKSKRVARKQAAHAKRMDEKYLPVDVRGDMADSDAPPKSRRRWPSRKMQSRPFQKGRDRCRSST